jgi:DNA-directed RNA polymerase sigma subunit (sigma70/sigma32)
MNREERAKRGLDPIWGRLPEEWELDPHGLTPQLTWSDDHNAKRNSPHRPGSAEWWTANHGAWYGLDDIEQEVIARRIMVPYMRRTIGRMEEVASDLNLTTEEVRTIRDRAVEKIRKVTS